MKELFVQYAAYHTWANGLLLREMEALTEEQRQRPVPSSFGSLHKTVLHLLDAESTWWQRLKLQERIERPSESFAGDFKTLADELLKQNRRWEEWTGAATEHGLQHEFIYRNARKQRFKQPVYQMLLHLFNYGTYHRGQVTGMLRQLGLEKIPATDFMEWARKRSGH